MSDGAALLRTIRVNRLRCRQGSSPVSAARPTGSSSLSGTLGAQRFRRGCGREKLRVEVVWHLVNHHANKLVANNNNYSAAVAA